MEVIKRLRIYFKEMYPIIPRLCLGYIVFLEIYFMVLLNHGVSGKRLLEFSRVKGQSDFISYFKQHDVAVFLSADLRFSAFYSGYVLRMILRTMNLIAGFLRQDLCRREECIKKT